MSRKLIAASVVVAMTLTSGLTHADGCVSTGGSEVAVDTLPDPDDFASQYETVGGLARVGASDLPVHPGSTGIVRSVAVWGTPSGVMNIEYGWNKARHSNGQLKFVLFKHIDNPGFPPIDEDIANETYFGGAQLALGWMGVTSQNVGMQHEWRFWYRGYRRSTDNVGWSSGMFYTLTERFNTCDGGSAHWTNHSYRLGVLQYRSVDAEGAEIYQGAGTPDPTYECYKVAGNSDAEYWIRATAGTGEAPCIVDGDGPLMPGTIDNSLHQYAEP